MSVSKIIVLEGTVTLWTKSVDNSPRGWYEGAVHYVDIKKHDNGTVHVSFGDKPEQSLLVDKELLEAALELLE